MGAQYVAQAANGIDVNSGSAVMTRTSSAIVGKYDALTVRQNAERTAQGYLNQGANFTGQAGVDTAAGANAGTAGTGAMIGSALSGAASLAPKWAALQTQTSTTQTATSGSGSPAATAADDYF